MSLPRFMLFAFAFLPALAAAQARLGDVVTCQPTQGCTEEVVDGRHFYILDTPSYLVRVAIQPEAKYNRADVSIENRTSVPVHLSPSDFRIEVADAKMTRLSYVAPQDLHLPKPKAEKAAKPSKIAQAQAFVATEEKKVVAAASELLLFAEARLAPAATASGRIYFQRTGGSSKMALIVPISGTIFEFPYTPAK